MSVNTSYTSAITYSTTVPARLYTDARAQNDGAARLAIGLAPYQPPVVPGLLDADGFDYPGADLSGKAGGVGWDTGWTAMSGYNSLLLSGDGVSLDYGGLAFSAPLTPPTPSGGRLKYGPHSSQHGSALREMKATLDLSRDGEVLWVSCLVRKSVDNGGSGEHIALYFYDNVGSVRATFGMGSNDKWALGVATSNVVYSAGACTLGQTYFLVGRFVSHPSTGINDEAAMWVFCSNGEFNGNTIPGTEEELLLLTPVVSHANANSNSILDRMSVQIGRVNTGSELDEVRIGSRYTDVVDGGAPLGEVPDPVNVLAVHALLAAGGNPLVLTGTTPIAAHTWHHFAMVYDRAGGNSLKGYLNGNLEIDTTVEVASAGSAPIVIGNDRMHAEVDGRNWRGMIDHIRIYDAAVPAAELMANLPPGGSPRSANLIWASNFETQKGQPVAHDQEVATGVEVEPGDTRRGFVSAIDNAAPPVFPGLPGAGYAVPTNQLLYLRYGQSGIGPAPDPAAGQFAFYGGPDRGWSIDTRVPSNFRNLNNRLVFTGYFNTWDFQVATTNHTVARRIFSQRTENDRTTRIGLGLERTSTGNALAVLYRSNTDPVNRTVITAEDLVPHRWYHVKLIYDGAKIRVYLDGALKLSFVPGDLAPAGSASILIGNGLGTGEFTHGFYGLLDELVITDDDGCGPMWADADRDGDVDQADFGIVQSCLTESEGTLADGCECFDREPVGGDGDVDRFDLEIFESCARGPEIPWIPGGLCVP